MSGLAVRFSYVPSVDLLGLYSHSLTLRSMIRLRGLFESKHLIQSLAQTLFYLQNLMPQSIMYHDIMMRVGSSVLDLMQAAAFQVDPTDL